MGNFDVIFDEGIGTPTGITDVTNRPDLIISTGRGVINISARDAQEVNVNAISGMHIARVNVLGGETKSVNVPTGVYIVNGVKIIV
ncbi:MAG: hypothetical protein IJ844_03785, partial [Prevotella sp.]|nr:hypothetical protein [Prevotella sp.]